MAFSFCTPDCEGLPQVFALNGHFNQIKQLKMWSTVLGLVCKRGRVVRAALHKKYVLGTCMRGNSMRAACPPGAGSHLPSEYTLTKNKTEQQQKPTQPTILSVVLESDG